MSRTTRPAPGFVTRLVVIASEAFIGVGAVLGRWELLADAEGFGLPEEWLEGSPFPDYRIPGLFLFIVLGAGMLIAAGITIVRARYASMMALAMGVILATWLIIETVVMGYRGGPQGVLLVVCGVPAVLLVVVGWRWRSAGGR